MQGIEAIFKPMCVYSPVPPLKNSNPTNKFPTKFPNPSSQLHIFSHFSVQRSKRTQTHFTWKASYSVGGTETMEEPVTKVKFQTSLTLPGCSSSLSLLGTGSREENYDN